jgi:hypothetical protein
VEAGAFHRHPFNPVRGFGALNQGHFPQGLEQLGGLSLIEPLFASCLSQ